MSYIDPNILFNSYSSIPKPEKLDSITILKDGIRFNLYGTLHGITGGTNEEYRTLVNKTISETSGLKLCEKGMKAFYTGLDEELDDFLAVPVKDVVRLTLALTLNPIRTYTFIKILIKERLTKKDKFKETGKKSDIGGSSLFHSLDPFARRDLVGFPSPQEYLRINLERRLNNQTFKLNMLDDDDWVWLNWIEPYANLPLRSIHMFEYALMRAKLENLNEVSLFVGEIHNTDMAHYMENSTHKEDLYGLTKTSIDFDNIIEKTVNTAKHSAASKFKQKFNTKNLNYMFGLLLGITIPFILYASIILGLKEIYLKHLI